MFTFNFSLLHSSVSEKCVHTFRKLIMHCEKVAPWIKRSQHTHKRENWTKNLQGRDSCSGNVWRDRVTWYQRYSHTQAYSHMNLHIGDKRNGRKTTFVVQGNSNLLLKRIFRSFCSKHILIDLWSAVYEKLICCG